MSQIVFDKFEKKTEALILLYEYYLSLFNNCQLFKFIITTIHIYLFKQSNNLLPKTVKSSSLVR